MGHLIQTIFLLAAFLSISTAQIPIDAGTEAKDRQIRISPEFHETDLADVLYYLKEVNGMNFAVDKGVEGSVTLMFKNPSTGKMCLMLS